MTAGARRRGAAERSMKILITGGAGFIGSAVARRAVAEGLAVVNVDALTHAGTLSNVADIEDNPRYAFEYADICDAEAMAAIFARHQPDWVLHMAEAQADRFAQGPLGFVRTNMGSLTLAKWAVRRRRE